MNYKFTIKNEIFDLLSHFPEHFIKKKIWFCEKQKIQGKELCDYPGDEGVVEAFAGR